MQKRRKKREMCPVCKVVSLKPAYYKKMTGGVLRWYGKDLLVCPSKFCTVLATHTNNRILYLVPHPNSTLSRMYRRSISTRILDIPLEES